jgi:hypothetical protein
MKRTCIFLLMMTLFANGYIQHASAQCRPADKIYIDPKVVPSRQDMTPELQRNISVWMANPWVPEWQKKAFMNDLAAQKSLTIEPIVVPYKGGRVLINPQNPCIQQYIPD